jgi:hypothetical protein
MQQFEAEIREELGIDTNPPSSVNGDRGGRGLLRRAPKVPVSREEESGVTG